MRCPRISERCGRFLRKPPRGIAAPASAGKRRQSAVGGRTMRQQGYGLSQFCRAGLICAVQLFRDAAWHRQLATMPGIVVGSCSAAYAFPVNAKGTYIEGSAREDRE